MQIIGTADGKLTDAAPAVTLPGQPASMRTIAR